MKKVLFACMIILMSCNDYELGNGYFYLSQDEAMDVGSPYGSIIYKSKQRCQYDKVVVYGDVLDCISDDNYILVSQKPNKEKIKELVEGGSYFNEDFLNQMFKNQKNYYIISKVNDSLIGPLDENEFLSKKKNMKIDLNFWLH